MAQPAPATNDRTTLWGVLGIVFAVCCPVIGIVFAVLSLMEARKRGTSPMLAYIGFVIAGINIVLNIIFASTGAYDTMF